VLVASLGAWVRALPWLLLVAIVVQAPEMAVSTELWLASERPSRLRDWSSAAALSGGILTFALSIVAQGILIHFVIQALRRQPASPRAALRAGLSRVGALFGVSFVVGFATLAAALPFLLVFASSRGIAIWLILLPALPLARWYVAAPAAVAERLPAWAALERSVRLTEGSRLRIGLLLLAQYGVTWGLPYAIQRVLFEDGGAPTLARLELVGLANVVASTFASVVPAVAYHVLRRLREGIDLDELARVFE
jgi:hypothetical protein